MPAVDGAASLSSWRCASRGRRCAGHAPKRWVRSSEPAALGAGLRAEGDVVGAAVDDQFDEGGGVGEKEVGAALGGAAEVAAPDDDVAQLAGVVIDAAVDRGDADMKGEGDRAKLGFGFLEGGGDGGGLGEKAPIAGIDGVGMAFGEKGAADALAVMGFGPADRLAGDQTFAGFADPEDGALNGEIVDIGAVVVDGMDDELLKNRFAGFEVSGGGETFEFGGEVPELGGTAGAEGAQDDLLDQARLAPAEGGDNGAVVKIGEDAEAELFRRIDGLPGQRGGVVPVAGGLGKVEAQLDRIHRGAGDDDGAVGPGFVDPAPQAGVVVDPGEYGELDAIGLKPGNVDQEVAVGELPLVRAAQLQSFEEAAADLEKVAHLPAALEERAEKRLSAVGERGSEVGGREHDEPLERAAGGIEALLAVVAPEPVADDEPAGGVDDGLKRFFAAPGGIDHAVLDETALKAVGNVIVGDGVLAGLVIGIENCIDFSDTMMEEAFFEILERGGAVAPAMDDEGVWAAAHGMRLDPGAGSGKFSGGFRVVAIFAFPPLLPTGSLRRVKTPTVLPMNKSPARSAANGINPSFRLLLVEQDAEDAGQIETLLAAGPESGGGRPRFMLEVVTGPEPALNRLAEDAFDVLLLGLPLGEEEGFAGLNALVSRVPEMPVVVLGPGAAEERGHEAVRGGAQDFLCKSRLDRALLVQAIRQAWERKQAERRISEQAALLDQAQDAIMMLDLDGGVTYWNHGAEQLYGWTGTEAKTARVTDLLFRKPDAFRQAVEQVIAEGRWDGEMEQINKQGDLLVVHARYTMARDSHGRPHAILALHTDLTERRQLEAQFNRAQRLESVGILAGGIAHDLNNMLSPILLSLELLKQQIKEDYGLTLLKAIESSAQRGAELVKQVLSFAQGVDGQRIPVNALYLASDIEKILRETFPRNIQVEAVLAHDAWLVEGDPAQLHQVLINLAVNALEAMPDGGLLRLGLENVELDANYAAMRSEARPGRYAKFTLSDDGRGIPADAIDRLYEPFYSTKPPGKGSGLGLPTALRIVRSHGGFIEFASTEGKGSTFAVYLPARAQRGPQTASRLPVPLPTGQGETVLVIDDEASIRMITSQTLESFGYRVRVAADGAEGLALFASHREEIKAVVVDLMMPVMDGRATIKALRRIQPGLKIIAVSGLKSEASLEDAEEPGATLFLPKPFTAETLLEALHEVLHPEEEEEAGD